MAENSKIEWTNHTFNPWWGCVKVAQGCRNCYAEGTSNRWGFKVWGQDVGRRFFGDAHWREPLKWNEEAKAAGKHALVFTGSMCDIAEDRPDLVEQRKRLIGLIESTPHLIYQLLTKRPENLTRLFATWGKNWPKNVWAGTSAAIQPELDRNAAHLLKCPASVLFISAEPLLGSLDFYRWLKPVGVDCVCGHEDNFVDDRTWPQWSSEKECGPRCASCGKATHWTKYEDGVDWVIVGGESGPGARPMHPNWARQVQMQCTANGVPFFFKQWGEFGLHQIGIEKFVPVKSGMWGMEDPVPMFRVGKSAAGRLLDGKEWNEMPEVRA